MDPHPPINALAVEYSEEDKELVELVYRAQKRIEEAREMICDALSKLQTRLDATYPPPTLEQVSAPKQP